jgi:hypothetical protein
LPAAKLRESFERSSCGSCNFSQCELRTRKIGLKNHHFLQLRAIKGESAAETKGIGPNFTQKNHLLNGSRYEWWG